MGGRDERDEVLVPGDREQHDEWQVANRYMSLDYLAKPLVTLESEEVLPELAAAS